MSKIRVLPDHISNLIAAGEVVERPASVAKELVENAIDAGATRIVIDVESGGRRLVKITDDGEGMIRDDAVLAFERHARSEEHTSELQSRFALVCRLLLEKKKKQRAQQIAWAPILSFNDADHKSLLPQRRRAPPAGASHAIGNSPCPTPYPPAPRSSTATP